MSAILPCLIVECYRSQNAVGTSEIEFMYPTGVNEQLSKRRW